MQEKLKEAHSFVRRLEDLVDEYHPTSPSKPEKHNERQLMQNEGVPVPLPVLVSALSRSAGVSVMSAVDGAPKGGKNVTDAVDDVLANMTAIMGTSNYNNQTWHLFSFLWTGHRTLLQFC